MCACEYVISFAYRLKCNTEIYLVRNTICANIQSDENFFDTFTYQPEQKKDLIMTLNKETN